MNSLLSKLEVDKSHMTTTVKFDEVSAPDAPNLYRELIKEAFLDPIKTAVIVDDEFPTLEEFLTHSTNDAPDADANWRKKRIHFDRVNSILKVCRSQRPHAWIVDVHDGKTPSLEQEKQAASHMDHTDLLVLDYHLDATGNGDKAISILRKLAASSHFNLVVIYTQTRSEHGLNQTIDDIALSLTQTDARISMHPRKVETLQKKFDKAVESGEIDIEVEDLKNQIDDLFLVSLLRKADRTFAANREQQEIAYLSEQISTLALTGAISEEECWNLILHYKQDGVSKRMASQSFGEIIADRSRKTVNWIRSDSLFVTVISKDFEPHTIPTKLLDALEAWNPAPHRLILTKMRSEIGKQGIVAEAQALSNQHLQAGWLQELLEKNEAKRRTKVRLGVSRHWESLGGKLAPHVFEYSEKLAQHLSENDGAGGSLARFELKNAITNLQEVHVQLNAHVCSKAVEGHHLFTGQIFELGERDKTYWLCLTPACDLEPGQRDGKGWNKRLGHWLPFKAVRLYAASREMALKEATRGYHVFANIGSEVRIFGFAQESSDSSWSTPTLGWEQFFAGNQGIFSNDGKLEVACVGQTSDINTDIKPAKVVAQLRYEYALNLNQRLGSHLSRVGLDFVSYRE